MRSKRFSVEPLPVIPSRSHVQARLRRSKVRRRSSARLVRNWTTKKALPPVRRRTARASARTSTGSQRRASQQSLLISSVDSGPNLTFAHGGIGLTNRGQRERERVLWSHLVVAVSANEQQMARVAMGDEILDQR